MNYICFVETQTSVVPYMEFFPVETLDQARVHARRLLKDHHLSVAVHIFQDDIRMDTIVSRDDFCAVRL